MYLSGHKYKDGREDWTIRLEPEDVKRLEEYAVEHGNFFTTTALTDFLRETVGLKNTEHHKVLKGIAKGEEHDSRQS